MRRIVFAVLFLVLTRSAGAQAQVEGSLAGVVTNNGNALPGVTITLTNAAGYSRTTVTGSEGRFGFLGVLPGNYTVTASAGGFATYSTSTEVRPGAAIALTIDLHGPQPVTGPATGTVIGKIWSGDESVPDAALDFAPPGGGDHPTTTSDAYGKYIRDYLVPGTYDVTCSANGYQSRTLTVTVVKDRSTSLDFTLVKK